MATEPSKTIPRPTGASASEYNGYKTWTYRRWAWEFLRRNPAFVADCKAAGDDVERQAGVARRYGLKRFKPYTERFTGASGRALFLSASVASWSNLDGAEVRNLRQALGAGQVLIRFDLSATVDDREAISAQLREAERIVRRHQRTYLAQAGMSEPRSHAAKAMYFLRHLRLLDLLEGKDLQHRDPGRALRIVNERPRLPMSDAEAKKEHRKHIGQARKLSEFGYRHLANRAGSPKSVT